jgi:hypothetical protein
MRIRILIRMRVGVLTLMRVEVLTIMRTMKRQMPAPALHRWKLLQRFIQMLM